jgi:hypothetical protein
MPLPRSQILHHPALVFLELGVEASGCVQRASNAAQILTEVLLAIKSTTSRRQEGVELGRIVLVRGEGEYIIIEY